MTINIATRTGAMSIHRNLSIVTTLVAATILSAAAAAAASVPAEPGGSSSPTAQTLATRTGSPGSEPMTGENALDYLSRLTREDLAAAQSGTDLSDYPGGTNGTSNGTLSAAQRGEPVGAGGTSGGSLSPFALASMR